jgi:hypothetical protein
MTQMSNSYLTHQDVENYGPELIDVTQRAALHAVTPHLQMIAEDNAMLRNRLAVEARHRLDAQVERAVPDYREIDHNPLWHRWLLGIDSLSGRVRQLLLNEAISAGDARRVKEFFAQFKREAGGAQTPAASRSRSSRAPSGQQIYTPKMIGQIYERRRKGEFSDEAFAKIEADIFDAQKSGRVQMVDYISK